jgi:hypothetical protein
MILDLKTNEATVSEAISEFLKFKSKTGRLNRLIEMFKLRSIGLYETRLRDSDELRVEG